MAPEALASTSNTATPNSGPPYDIFINHRGEDVKNTFASHLYNCFKQCGFSAFLDKEALQVGETVNSQIEVAIATASVHIAIFSPRYAESPWCLNELVQMLASGAPIIPVFYKVKPSQLQCTSGKECRGILPSWTGPREGVYAKALRNLKKEKIRDAQTGRKRPQYEASTIETWREALSRVSDIAGLELEVCNGDEGKLADKIAQRVKELLKEKESRKGMKGSWLTRLLNG